MSRQHNPRKRKKKTNRNPEQPRSERFSEVNNTNSDSTSENKNPTNSKEIAVNFRIEIISTVLAGLSIAIAILQFNKYYQTIICYFVNYLVFRMIRRYSKTCELPKLVGSLKPENIYKALQILNLIVSISISSLDYIESLDERTAAYKIFGSILVFLFVQLF